MIYIQLKLNNKKYTNLIGYYRQWNISRNTHIDNNRYDNQEFRYSKAIEIWSKILSDNNDFIIVGDDNIDTLHNNIIYPMFTQITYL